MDRHRTRFLASLSARLEQERTLRESEVEPPPIWRRPAGQSDPASEPIPAEPASSARISEPKGPAGGSLRPDDRTTPAPLIVASRSTDRLLLGEGALETSKPEQTSVGAVPWSETGMPKALRDAIASVRRVSHEIDEPQARRGLSRYAPPPDRDPVDEEVSVGPAAVDDRPFDRHLLHDDRPFDADIAPERFGDQALHDEPPVSGYVPEAQERPDQSGGVDERHAFDRSWQDQRAALEERAWHDEQRLDVGADAPLPFGDRASREKPSFDDGADAHLPLGGRASRKTPSFDDRVAAPLLSGDDDDAADEPSFDEPGYDAPAQGLRETPQDRPALWRKAPERRRLSFAPFAIATVFVVLAAFGIAIVSGAREIDRWVANLGLTPLADAIVGDRQTEAAPSSASPAPLSGDLARPAEAETTPQLSELETVRVAPLPAPPGTEQSPGVEQAPEPTTNAMPLPPPPRLGQAPEPTTNAMPLPPPAKPALPPSASEEEAPASDRIAGAVNEAVEDAAVALREADGAGGPFEPILVKTSAFGPRVFVHYTESAPGSPATALHLVRHLRAAGLAVEARAVDFPISEHSIRYFFDRDRDDAEALVAQLDGQVPGGDEVPVLDFTGFEPKPREGHLEVWLGR